MKIPYHEIKTEIEKRNFSLAFERMGNVPFVGIRHIHEWDHGYESDLGYAGKRREFYADMRDMTSFLMNFIDENHICECIIAPLHRVNQFCTEDKHNDIYLEIRNFLKQYDVRSGSQSGIKLPIVNNISVLEMVVEGAFRGISELCILFTDCDILLAPNHHFDFPFFTYNPIQSNKVIDKLLLQHPNLRYYNKL